MQMKVVLFGKNYKKDFDSYAKVLIQKLIDFDTEVFIHSDILRYYSKWLKESGKVHIFFGKEDLPEHYDFFISIGGDGTFLEAVTYVRDSGIPVVGINSGRLGFLANISKNEIANSIEAIVQNKYKIEKRTLLELETEMNLFGEDNYALNELTIHKKDSSAMITVHTFMNDEFLNSYWSDGLIVSTPTGSTAYSLSVGGPLVLPNSQNFIISPIAPHNLTVRPLVIPDKFELTLEVEGRNKQFLLALDSRSVFINEGIQLKVKKASFELSVLKLPGQTYYKTLRNKLMWGVDNRN
ncbi:MAG: NAD kinase [Bacteroidales bacterium]|nr:NAD kinase [Bacteroidales bacterium]